MDLVEIFERLMEQCRCNEKLIKAIIASIQNQTVIFESDPVTDDFASAGKGPVVQYLSDKRSLEAAKQYAKAGKRVCVLNFASFVTPGGGVTRGSKAQEESLCRISTLYPTLTAETAAPFYDAHHEAINKGTSTRKNNDDCIFTPGVIVVCEDNFECTPLPEDEWYTVDVITCAAPDQRYTSVGEYHPTDSELFEVMAKRIDRIYAIAAQHQADVLIMGAFGCGVFHNSPEIVARAFEAVTKKYQNVFECVEYAVAGKYKDNPNYRAFKKIKGIVEGA